MTDDYRHDFNPAWSPDGTKIAFERNSEIYAMNADGTGQTILTGEGIDLFGSSPTWSPDGSKIAFSGSAGLASGIYVMNADGTGVELLSTGPVFNPAWSPDGTKIAFQDFDPGSLEYAIYIINAADGTGRTKLKVGMDPSWSPDGTKIAFGTHDASTGRDEIHVMNADGTGEINITNDPNIGERDPAWSPDGTKIAFFAFSLNTFDNAGIFVKNSDGSGTPILLASDGNTPDWGPKANQSILTINSADLSGKPLKGMWTVIRLADGTIAKTGFTPLTFTADSGSNYKVSVANYDSKVFARWEDGTTSKTRIVNLSADTTITASYDVEDILMGFTSLTYTGTEEQPDLTVNAVSAEGGKALHMWTIIDPQESSDASGMTYKVYASNYQDRVFEKWEDGSESRTRTLTIQQDTLLTAYYRLDPALGPQTTTITTDTDFDVLLVKKGDTLIVNQGVTVTANYIKNLGNILNHGTIETHHTFDLVNDGGVVDTYGIVNVHQGDLFNVNGGIINIKEGGSLLITRSSSAFPGSLVNEGTINKECGATFEMFGSFTGNALIDKC